jgi:hypothetical protein
MPVTRYVETCYFPDLEEENGHNRERLRTSTLTEYHRMWDAYLRPDLGGIRLRDFRCADGGRLLRGIGRKHRLSRNSFYHIKGFMSGVFKHAKRTGVLP